MTVETTTRRVIANGNGIATSFSFNPMVIYQSSDLVVVKRDTLGVETVLAEGTGASDYAVVVTTYPGTGTITFPASGTTLLASGEKLAIVPRISIKQETDLDNQGGYFADVQELQFDKLVHIDQQQQEQINRSLKISVSDTAVTSVDLGSLTSGYVLAVNNDATGFLWSASLPGNVTVSPFMATVLDDTTAAAARTTLGVSAAVEAINALTPAADRLPYFTSSSAAALTTFTSFARTLVDDATAAAARTTLELDGFVPRNPIVNGGMAVAQRATLTTSANSLGDTLGSTAKIGKVDGFAGYASAGTITAGTLTQDTSATIGDSGNALLVSGLTMTGSAKWCFAHRIEAKDATALKNKAAIFACRLLHDIGSSKNAVITISKPTTTADDFSSLTTIATSASLPVADATGTQISLAVTDMGDCSKGISIVVELDTGAITTKAIRTTEWMLVRGAAIPAAFPAAPFADDLARCQRYFYKSFPYATAPATNAGVNGSRGATYYANTTGVTLNFELPQTMRASPTVIIMNPSSGSANVRDTTNNADINVAGTTVSDNHVRLQSNAGTTAPAVVVGHITAQSELF